MDHDQQLAEILRLQQENLRWSQDNNERLKRVEEAVSGHDTEIAVLKGDVQRAQDDIKTLKATADQAVSKTTVLITSGAISTAVGLAIALADVIVKR